MQGKGYLDYFIEINTKQLIPYQDTLSRIIITPHDILQKREKTIHKNNVIIVEQDINEVGETLR